MKRYIDISQKLRNGLSGVDIKSTASIDTEGWSTSVYSIASSAGTHIAAPVSFGIMNEDVASYAPSRFITKAWIADVDDVIAGDVLTCDILGEIEDNFQPGESLILRTGWSRFIEDTEMYLDKLPTLGRDLVDWCIRKKVNILGVEPPSVAAMHHLEELQFVHRALFRGNVIVLEGLCNLDKIQSDYVDLYVFPLLIEGADACPARVMVVEEAIPDTKV